MTAIQSGVALRLHLTPKLGPTSSLRIRLTHPSQPCSMRRVSVEMLRQVASGRRLHIPSVTVHCNTKPSLFRLQTVKIRFRFLLLYSAGSEGCHVTQREVGEKPTTGSGSLAGPGSQIASLPLPQTSGESRYEVDIQNGSHTFGYLFYHLTTCPRALAGIKPITALNLSQKSRIKCTDNANLRSDSRLVESKFSSKGKARRKHDH